MRRKRKRRADLVAEAARATPFQCAREVADYGERGCVIAVLGCRHATREEAAEHVRLMEERARELGRPLGFGETPALTRREREEWERLAQ